MKFDLNKKDVYIDLLKIFKEIIHMIEINKIPEEFPLPLSLS